MSHWICQQNVIKTREEIVRHPKIISCHQGHGAFLQMHHNAEALSRLPCPEDYTLTERRGKEHWRWGCTHKRRTSDNYDKIWVQWGLITVYNEVLKQLFETDDGTVQKQQFLVLILHNGTAGGHLGVKKALEHDLCWRCTIGGASNVPQLRSKAPMQQ